MRSDDGWHVEPDAWVALPGIPSRPATRLGRTTTFTRDEGGRIAPAPFEVRMLQVRATRRP